MLAEPLEDPETTSQTALLDRYGGVLADAVSRVDRDVLREAGVEGPTIDAIKDGEYGAVTVGDAAAILGTRENGQPAAVIEAEVQDQLLVGMANAVLDVDALAAELDADLTPREIQQRIEGRAPLRLDTYAALRLIIATQ